jgi:hypothetical protein
VKLDDGAADWLLSTAAWWLREFGPLDDTPLVLPTDAHFPGGGAPDELLDAVVEHAGLDGWEFVLEDESDAVLADPMPAVPRPAVARAVLVAVEGDATVPPGGPFPIPYTREDAASPVRMVAVLARGVSHYLLFAARDAPPGDDRHRAAIAEVGAVLLGFGVFLANAAFEFERFESGPVTGWRAGAHGELGEDALGFALALFVELTGADPRAVSGHLSANPRAAFTWALGQLRGDRRADLERLRAVVPVAPQSPYR